MNRQTTGQQTSETVHPLDIIKPEWEVKWEIKKQKIITTFSNSVLVRYLNNSWFPTGCDLEATSSYYDMLRESYRYACETER